MAELASDPEKLTALSTLSVGSSDGFEGLYQVRTMGNLNVGSELLIGRPLRSRGVWDNSGRSQRFPPTTRTKGAETPGSDRMAASAKRLADPAIKPSRRGGHGFRGYGRCAEGTALRDGSPCRNSDCKSEMPGR